MTHIVLKKKKIKKKLFSHFLRAGVFTDLLIIFFNTQNYIKCVCGGEGKGGNFNSLRFRNYIHMVLLCARSDSS